MATEYELKKCFPCLPRTVRGIPLVIGGDPKGSNILYCNGNSVVIRDLENPSKCDIYTEHSTLTTVAKYSPSGFYIVSGDQTGKIRIWDTTNKTHILKAEYHPIFGAIKDIAWSADSQRIAVVGEGKEKFGHVFLMDTGTSNGNLSGQSKVLNSIDIRPIRPIRLVTASEDYTVGLFEGPPFKFKTTLSHHTRFAQCVRYAPDGARFASGGADGKLFIYEGVEGAVQGECVDPACKGNAHSGGVYALSWSPDNRRILTASGDKSCKLWDADSYSLIKTFVMGKTLDEMQVSCLWQGEHMISISLSGFINYLDENLDEPKRILMGHNKAITALALSDDRSRIYTTDMEGNIVDWNAETGDCTRLNKVHPSQIQSVAFRNNLLVTVAMDDTVAFTNVESKTFESVKLSSQPRGVSISQSGSVVSVVCQKEVILFRNAKIVAKLAADFDPSCVAVHPTGGSLVVGGNDSKVRVYQVAGDQLTLTKELTHSGAITDVKFSDDGSHFAVCDQNRRVVPYLTQTCDNVSKSEWTFHSARVNCLAWSPDNRRIATGSLDTNIIVWDLEKTSEHPLIIKGAHPMSHITGIAWLDANTVISAGQDANLKQFSVFL